MNIKNPIGFFIFLERTKFLYDRAEKRVVFADRMATKQQNGEHAECGRGKPTGRIFPFGAGQDGKE